MGPVETIIRGGFVGEYQGCPLSAMVDKLPEGWPVGLFHTSASTWLVSLSLTPATAVLPTVPRPALNFLLSCLLPSLDSRLN